MCGYYLLPCCRFSPSENDSNHVFVERGRRDLKQERVVDKTI